MQCPTDWQKCNLTARFKPVQAAVYRLLTCSALYQMTTTTTTTSTLSLSAVLPNNTNTYTIAHCNHSTLLPHGISEPESWLTDSVGTGFSKLDLARPRVCSNDFSVADTLRLLFFCGLSSTLPTNNNNVGIGRSGTLLLSPRSYLGSRIAAKQQRVESKIENNSLNTGGGGQLQPANGNNNYTALSIWRSAARRVHNFCPSRRENCFLTDFLLLLF